MLYRDRTVEHNQGAEVLQLPVVMEIQVEVRIQISILDTRGSMANDEVDYPIVEKNAMDFEKTERREHQEHRTYLICI